jgi:hypothetical protein
MAELKLIHGKQSVKYDHFKEFDFESCRAVCTRLMGVVALKVTWRSKTDRRERMYQVIHLDYSEYGIDEYKEFLCTPGSEDFADRKDEMTAMWNHFVYVMGGSIESIDAACMLRLIEDALPLASENISREYDSEENREFRAYARMRIGFMQDALNCDGITSADCSTRDAIETASPLKLSAYETINYFIMRLVDCDFAAASYLSTIRDDDLRDCELTGPGIQTLIKCDIERSDRKTDVPADRFSFPFRCRLTTLARDAYYHYTLVIWLNGNYRSKNPLVTDIRVGSVIKLSDYEAAIQISRPEFLTVFDCKDEMLKGFDPKYVSLFANSTQMAVPNGWLYTAYRGDNSHVDTSSYRLNDDVYGFALLSIAGELILMSNELRYISMLDDSTIFSMYSPFISTKGRYRLDTPVFQTLCGAPGVMFDDMVEPEGE